MTDTTNQRKLAAIMAADVAGYRASPMSLMMTGSKFENFFKPPSGKMVIAARRNTWFRRSSMGYGSLFVQVKTVAV